MKVKVRSPGVLPIISWPVISWPARNTGWCPAAWSVTSTMRTISGTDCLMATSMPLAESDRGHAAAGAPAAQAEIGRPVLHRHEVGTAAVGGDGRVDLGVEDLDDALGHVAAQVRRRPGHGRAGPGHRRVVGVADAHPPGQEVTVEVEHRAHHVGRRCRGDHDGQARLGPGPSVGPASRAAWKYMS